MLTHRHGRSGRFISLLAILLILTSLLLVTVPPVIPVTAASLSSRDTTAEHNLSAQQTPPDAAPTVERGLPAQQSSSDEVPAFGTPPVMFVPDSTSTQTNMRFKAAAFGGSVFFTPREVVFALPDPTQESNSAPVNAGYRGALPERAGNPHTNRTTTLDPRRSRKTAPIPLTAVRMEFVHARSTTVSGTALLATQVHALTI